MKWSLIALLIGFIIDFFVGDPHGFPHPIVLIGKLISALEKGLRRLFPATPRGERAAGAALWVLTAGLSAAVPALILYLCHLASPWLRLTAESVMCWQILAARSLERESMKVYKAWERGDIAASRYAVSMSVGRDTAALDDAAVTRAAVETVAENTCDGVIAPLVFLFLGGLPLVMAFKGVSTLDSMVGYRTPRYRYFGTAAARLDDLLNFLPARLSGLLLCLGAALLPGCSGRGAWRVFRRDRRKHASPNSAHTEAACAGALGVRLAGDAWYFGTLVHKPTLGDPLREAEPEDIPRACRLMYAAQLLALLGMAACSLAISIV